MTLVEAICGRCARPVPECCITAGICGRCRAPELEQLEAEGREKAIAAAIAAHGMHMRYKKHGARVPHQVNPTRRLAAAKRAVNRQKEKLGFLAELYEFETPEDRVSRIERSSIEGLKADRDRRAYEWRTIRQVLRSLPNEKRFAVIHDWNIAPFPADPVYFVSSVFRKHGVTCDLFTRGVL